MVFSDTPCALGLDECLFCLDPASSSLSRNPTPLESVWTENCVESVCKLLDLPLETFRPFFLAGQYCPNCKQMIRDVDYLIRSVESFQLRLSEYRVKVSALLHENIETWIDKTNITSSSTSGNGSTEVDLKNHGQQSVSFYRFRVKQEEDHDDGDSIGFSVPTPENNDCINEEQVPQPTRSQRVTRASNRLRKEMSYREDSDLEESGPPTLANNLKSSNLVTSTSRHVTLSPVVTEVSAGTTLLVTGILRTNRRRKRNMELTKAAGRRLPDPDGPIERVDTGDVTPLPTRREKKRGSKLLRGDDEELDPTFDLSQVTERGHNSDSEQDGQERAKVIVPQTVKRPRRGPSEMAAAMKAEAEYNATVNFLEKLDQEEIGKNYAFVCKSEGCNRRFMEMRQLQRHKFKEHSEALFPCSYQCPFCPSRRFRFDYQLDAHLLRVHGGEKRCFICPIPNCSSKYRENPVLVSHLQTQHPNYTIEESRTTPFSFGLEHRDQTVPGHGMSTKNRGQVLNVLRCQVPGCPKRCTSQFLLDMHQAKVHDKDPLPFKCREGECTKAFKRYNQLRDHMKLRHGATGNFVKCLFCPYRTLGWGLLNTHMRKQHGREDVPKFHCKFCGHFYFVSSDCEKHEKLHTEETGWSCVIYGCQVQGLTTQEALRAHIQTGHDEKVRRRVICDICGSVQANNTLLKQHTRVHTGEEPFKCRYCDNRFKNLHHRTRHEEITHADQMEKKTYNCKLCDETFTVRQYLYKHNAWHKHGANANRPIAKKKPI